jgi:hypothetical protein
METSGRPDRGVCAAVDVHYLSTGGARAAVVLAADTAFAHVVAEHTAVVLPEQLKAAIEEIAAAEGRSVNAWLVRAAAAALQQSDREQRPEPRGRSKPAKQGFTGWVR